MIKTKIYLALEMALHYAKLGWQVFPLLRNKKKPATPHGFLDGSNDTDEINKMFFGDNNYNYGIVTGTVSNIFGIDVDNKNGKNGSDEWEKFTKEQGIDCNTFTVETPTNGYHYYFDISNCDPAVIAQISSGQNFLLGVDWRGDGGYLVGPGSKIDGKEYTIIHNKQPIPMPAKLLDALIKAKSKAKSKDSGAKSKKRGKFAGAVITQGERDNACFKEALKLRKQGCSEEEIVKLVLDMAQNCEPPFPEREAIKCIESSKKYCLGSVIHITSSNANVVADQCIELLKQEDKYFITKVEPATLVEVKKDLSGTRPLDVEGLKYVLNGLTEFTVLDKKTDELKNISCPTAVAKNLLSLTVNQDLNKIKFFVSVPILHADLSVVETNGYDPLSQYYFYSNEIFEINKNPTDQDLRQAYKDVINPFRFYKMDSLSRANLLCALFVVITQPLLNTCPIFVITSPYAGSGKTYMAQCITWLLGMNKNSRKFPKNEEELEKSILTAVKSRKQSMLWDNFNGELTSTSLCSAVTCGSIEGRKLGVNDDIEGEYKVMNIFTGKNIILLDDLFRRTLKIIIDPSVPNPEESVFDFNPVDRVKKHRVRIISALFTLLFGYKNAGLPKINTSVILQSFEDFDKYNRQLVLWLETQLKSWGLTQFSLDDPIKTIAQNKKEGDAVSDSNGLIAALYALYKDEDFTSNDIDFDKDGDNSNSVKKELQKALLDSLVSCFGNQININARKIGHHLHSQLKNKICEIVDATDHKIRVKLIATDKKTTNKTWFNIVKM